jgi:hypothetical protein
LSLLEPRYIAGKPWGATHRMMMTPTRRYDNNYGATSMAEQRMIHETKNQRQWVRWIGKNFFFVFSTYQCVCGGTRFLDDRPVFQDRVKSQLSLQCT